MSLVAFAAKNHRQQVEKRGADDEVDDRSTPPDLFAALDKEFGFTLDVAAALHNAKCSKFFTRADDGLSKPWAGERVWCNPPYSDIRPWVEKAWRETDGCPVIVMLLPASRTEQAWWQDLVEPVRDGSPAILRTRFIRGRQRFLKPGEVKAAPNNRPPFGVVLLVWRRP